MNNDENSVGKGMTACKGIRTSTKMIKGIRTRITRTDRTKTAIRTTNEIRIRTGKTIQIIKITRTKMAGIMGPSVPIPMMNGAFILIHNENDVNSLAVPTAMDDARSKTVNGIEIEKNDENVKTGGEITSMVSVR